MTPVTVTAHLGQPAAIKHPPMLDALLYVGLHRRLQQLRPAEYPVPVADPRVFALPLPLARVERDGLWWWAASQATPTGPEAVRHEHRRPAVDAYAVYQGGDRIGKVDLAAGPDKGLRVPVYTRPGWLAPTWTCVVDPAQAELVADLLGVPNTPPVDVLAALLDFVPSIGARTNAGHGAISGWSVTPSGPPLEHYATDVALRHLPASLGLVLPSEGRVVRADLPLRPPYYGGERVACLQVRP